MKRWLWSLLVCVMMWCCSSAAPGSGQDSGLNRFRRSSHCTEETEYHHGDLCCKNCPAGTHMKSPCTRSGARGECEECGVGTYTDFGNGLKKCLSCSLCRTDQEVVRPCGSTHNTECQCRPGGFCAPDQACEICKRCARCAKDEVVVRNCTATTNTECKKKPAESGQATDWTLSVALGLTFPLALAVIVALLVFCAHRRRRKAADSGRSQGALTSGYSETEKSNGTSPRCWTLVRPRSLPLSDLEEQTGLCETSASASNSQANLIPAASSDSQGNLTLNPPPCALPTPAQTSCVPVLMLNKARVEEPRFNVVPVKGEASLRKCFEFFEELLDVHYHNRFFRHLGLTDNQIKSKDSLTYVDRVHDLLNFWLEKRGKEASLKDLLKALMDLNQRRTAEMIVERAVEAGYYVYEG